MPDFIFELLSCKGFNYGDPVGVSGKFSPCTISTEDARSSTKSINFFGNIELHIVLILKLGLFGHGFFDKSSERSLLIFFGLINIFSLYYYIIYIFLF